MRRHVMIVVWGLVTANVAVAATPVQLVLHPKARALGHNYEGPFVKMADGVIVGIEGNTCIRSGDGGKTWTSNDLLTAEQKKTSDFSVRPERALLLTKGGSLIAAFSDDLPRKWTWDNKLKDAPGAVLPTWAIRSTDGGRTWRDIHKLHDDWTGAVRDIIQTKSGRIVFTTMKMLHDPGRHASMTYVSDDDGVSWQAGGLIDLGGGGNHDGTLEPSVVELRDGRVWMIIRTTWGQFWSGYSVDGGRFFRTLEPSGIAASSAPAIVKRLASGRLAMAWNRPYPEGQTTYKLSGGDGVWSQTAVSNHRGELSLAFSEDDGKTWGKPTVIARKPGTSLAYPYLFEIEPGRLWITTMQGGVRAELSEGDFAGRD